MEIPQGLFPILRSFFIAAGGFFCVIFALLQMTANRKGETIRYLNGLLFLTVGISILCDPLSRPGTAWIGSALLYVNYPLDYLVPVILYFYFRLLFEEHIALSKGYIIFLLPFLIVTAAFMPFFILSPAEKLELYPLDHFSWGYLSLFCRYADYGIFFWMLFLMFLSLRATWVYLSSPIGQVKAIVILLSSAGLLASSLIVSNFTENLVHYQINMLLMIVLLIGLAGMTVRDPDFYLKIRKRSSEIKYNCSQLANLNIKGIRERIDDLMELEQIYRDPELTLERLSALLHINRQQLSEIVNTLYGQNFKIFLNARRIEAVRKELLEDRNSAILVVALNCGFNSKSTFNKVFQDMTGKTPSSWRKEQSSRRHPQG